MLTGLAGQARAQRIVRYEIGDVVFDLASAAGLVVDGGGIILDQRRKPLDHAWTAQQHREEECPHERTACGGGEGDRAGAFALQQ
jgi:hypothetical protein